MQVATALRDEIGSKYDTADPDSCRYDINKQEKQGNFTYVYGSVTLYDKYGKLTTAGGTIPALPTAATPSRSITPPGRLSPARSSKQKEKQKQIKYRHRRIKRGETI